MQEKARKRHPKPVSFSHGSVSQANLFGPLFPSAATCCAWHGQRRIGGDSIVEECEYSMNCIKLTSNRWSLQRFSLFLRWLHVILSVLLLSALHSAKRYWLSMAAIVFITCYYQPHIAFAVIASINNSMSYPLNDDLSLFPSLSYHSSLVRRQRAILKARPRKGCKRTDRGWQAGTRIMIMYWF